jgi:branched-chain amino acid transport system ATP-binding protein
MSGELTEGSLATESLLVRHGRLVAVRDVSIAVAPGEVLAIVGQNGAGKTTLLSALVGLLRPAGGRVLLDGTDVTGAAATRMVARGVSLVPEGRRLFPGESVLDNLLLGGHVRRRDGDLRERVDELLQRVPMLRPHLSRQAGLLSGGQQQMLAILRGVMSAPRYLLLDEPFSGLSPRARDEVAELVRGLAADGTGLVIVEQLAASALAAADRAHVMHDTRIVLSGSADELSEGSAVYQAYLGRDLTNTEMS